MAVSHASDMGCKDYFCMRPKGMRRWKWLRCSHVNESRRKMSTIESCKKGIIIRMRPATDQNHTCPRRQARNKPGIDQAFRFRRERQKADKYICLCNEFVKPILTGKTLHTLNILLAAAPAGQWETERLERCQRGPPRYPSPITPTRRRCALG